MIDLPFVRDKTYAVFALGITGISVGHTLIASGAKVLAWDEKESARAAAAAAGLPLADLSTIDLKGIDALVLSPGIPTKHPAPHLIVKRFQDAGIRITSDIELLLQAQDGTRVIAITGTNGKSTTTALVAHILNECGMKNAVGGNLGQAALTLPPMLASGRKEDPDNGTYVLEISSYQLDLLPKRAFDIALLLNITPDHLDRHGGMAGYTAAKASIFDGALIAIIATDDAPSAAIADKLGNKAIRISANDIAPAKVGPVTTLPGMHNAQNIAAAFAVARALNLDEDKVIAAIRSFPGLAHRQELVETIDNIRFINDSKATNPDAAQKALVCYDPIYWIAGGKPKDGGFESLNDNLKPVRHAFLIGEAANDMAAWLETQGIPYTITETLDRAVKHAATLAKEEDLDHAVVLLSPACASFDQFPNFEKRGELFRNTVRALEVGAAG